MSVHLTEAALKLLERVETQGPRTSPVILRQNNGRKGVMNHNKPSPVAVPCARPECRKMFYPYKVASSGEMKRFCCRKCANVHNGLLFRGVAKERKFDLTGTRKVSAC